MNGTLYLIPVTLGEESNSVEVLPSGTLSILRNLKELKKGTGVITANIDPRTSIDLRKRIPSLRSN